MPTWGQAIGRTLADMAPQVGAKMQAGIDTKRKTGAYRTLARIALMGDPVAQKAEIDAALARNDISPEEVQVLAGIAPQAAAGIQSQKQSVAAANAFGLPDAGGLPLDMIPELAKRNTENARYADVIRHQQKVDSVSDEGRARIAEHNAWLTDPERGGKVLTMAMATVPGRNGSILLAPGAREAQTEYYLHYRGAGNEGVLQSFPEDEIFAPREQQQRAERSPYEKYAILSGLISSGADEATINAFKAENGINGATGDGDVTPAELIAEARASINNPNPTNAEISAAISADMARITDPADKAVYQSTITSLGVDPTRVPASGIMTTAPPASIRELMSVGAELSNRLRNARTREKNAGILWKREGLTDEVRRGISKEDTLAKQEIADILRKMEENQAKITMLIRTGIGAGSRSVARKLVSGR
jgi:hypothetical protein